MMTNKILAAGSVALMGAGALLGTTTAANAFTDADCGDLSGMTFGFLSDNFDDVCVAVGLGAGNFTFTPPPGTTEVEAILVGGGGASATDGYGYAGNGGDVIFVDVIDPTETLEITLGAGGVDGGSVGGDGEASTLTVGTDVFTANGGDGGFNGVGESGAGYQGATASDTYTRHGGGAGGAATPDGPGIGVTENDPDLIGIDNDLWAPTDNSVFGAGGSGTSNQDQTNWGNGGDAWFDGSTWNLESGEDGIVEVHYRLGSAAPLASTGVDAAPMGIAAAGMLVAGGVGLAIARRARRSK